MSDNTRLLEDTVKVSNEQNRLVDEIILQDGGFIGVRLDEDTVQLLESKFREQKKDIRILWLVAEDAKGNQVVAVPQERVDVRSFARKEALWKHVGKIDIEEVETITIVRPTSDPARVVLDPWYRPGEGQPCIQYSTVIKQRPKQEKKNT